MVPSRQVDCHRESQEHVGAWIVSIKGQAPARNAKVAEAHGDSPLLPPEISASSLLIYFKTGICFSTQINKQFKKQKPKKVQFITHNLVNLSRRL